LALHPFVALMGLCAARLLVRMVAEHLQSRILRRGVRVRRVLVLGAGEAARRLVAGIQGPGWEILGLLDDDPAKRGTRVARLPVLGPMAQVTEWASALQATHLVLAMPSVQGSARRRVIDWATQTGLPVLTVPSADELREGTQTSRVRDIEPDDLLGREPVSLDNAGLTRLLEGQVVAVTGAGGSIGAELCMQLCHWRPSRLVLIDHSEYALYQVEQRLRERHPQQTLEPCLVDVKDAEALRACLTRHAPQLVLHAAAYKHVPLVESDNAWAALRNNALGTWVTARVAAEAGAQRFVLVSTDKAVNPTNVMGATKRAAERLMAALAGAYPSTRFMAVRFGNVLGSSGSVIPRFKEQIARGGPVTVTHPEIIRYFMTIPEACRLVLQAACIGDSGQVLVLDMGSPVRIVDLARTMIRMSGHREDEIPIVYTGLRPGEKLYEELLADEESTDATTAHAVRLARLRDDLTLQEAQQWCAFESGGAPWDLARVRQHLRRLVPEYRPTEGTPDLSS
jgi:FlaA1/EpsC-like NDP-sugar epimerase